MKKYLLAVVLALSAVSPVSAGPAKTASEWYVNMRYAFSIAFPKEIFLPQGEAADGSGQRFLSRDGKAVASAYGQTAPESSSLITFYNETLANLMKEGWKITHKTFKGDVFTLQGTNGADNFYKKVVYKPLERQFVSFEAVYPVSKGKYYGPVVSAMAGSVKILQARACRPEYP